eukprot:TRINITY_DN22599_c0_g1_i1.p1 TRINITY_DN22599_c0_g1~~TRINITY_DN22599_c0_g1_i1.p1  ORF type:complete len:107 (+),score=8.68 TRINITY_DN22599_c0_g1_i1:120-440(+)
MNLDEDIRVREAELRAQINQKLEETGEKAILKKLLKTKLLSSGWHDGLKAHCAEVIRRKGLDDISLDTLVEEITPHARDTVPDTVKQELLRRIRTFLNENRIQPGA